VLILNNCTVLNSRRCNYRGNDYFGLSPRTWKSACYFRIRIRSFVQNRSAACCLVSTTVYMSWSFMATEFKCSQSDRRVQMWRFPDVSGTQSVAISDCIHIFTFKIRTEPVSESLHILTGLSAQEHFIELRCFMVWNANAPSATNTVSFDLLPEAVKNLLFCQTHFTSQQLSKWTQEILVTFVWHRLLTKSINLVIFGQLKKILR